AAHLAVHRHRAAADPDYPGARLPQDDRRRAGQAAAADHGCLPRGDRGRPGPVAAGGDEYADRRLGRL
ncbi:MAG: hypothetical protein AVDCRST_MAG27-1271, partial [uncultured Craurococcus sp.]